jgi:hypothetical protein
MVGLPGGEGILWEKCDDTPEKSAGKDSLSEGLIEGKGKMGISENVILVKRVSSERARRIEIVSVGFTKIGVTDKKIWAIEVEGPVYE